MRIKVLSEREYRGHIIQHMEEDAFRGATARNQTGWFIKRFWWVQGDENSDYKTLREVKQYVDRA